MGYRKYPISLTRENGEKEITRLGPVSSMNRSEVILHRLTRCSFVGLLGWALCSIAVLLPDICSASSPPTLIRSISLTGNHHFTERQLLDAMAAKQGAPYSAEGIKRDIDAIVEIYHSEGYYFTDVRLQPIEFTSDSASVELRITINEGEKGTIASLGIEGNSVFTVDDILSRFDTRKGAILDAAVLEHDIDGLITRYEKSGYPFTKIKIETIAPAANDSIPLLNVALSIDEGARVRIREFRVSGNSETNEHVIIRETGISPGEFYDPGKVANIRNRLNRLNVFSQVDDPQLYITKEEDGGIGINVKEGNTNTFDGILGFIPAAGASGDEGYFTGLVNISMRNLFGTARKFSVRWQKDDRNSQELAFRYLEPWIFDLPLDVEASFDQRQQDTVYVRREVETKANLRFTDAFSVGGILTSESIIPSASIAGAFLSKSSTLTAGVELKYDSRDDIVYPSGGVYYLSDYQVGSKSIAGGIGATGVSASTNAVQRLRLDLETYMQPVNRQVIALGLHGRQLTSGNIEISDLYRFGGATTLRGYRENQFLGSRLAWTNAEYRFVMARHSYFFGFFDTGYYFLPADPAGGTTENQHFRYGYGIGTRFETSIGNIGVSFALGQGDTFSRGKIHVGLINDF